MRAFIGRVDELRALAQVSSTPDGTAAALVTGEPGCGKSRLLTEARLASGIDAFAVVGFESEQNVPLAAAGGLLRLLAAVPEHGDLLEAFLMGGRARGGHPRGRAAADIAPLQIFEAARRAFRTVEPALLLVDDLQWVDELSLSLCHYLIRAASEAQHRLAVFASTRPDSAGEALLATLPPDRVIEIHLGPLNRADGVALVRTLDARVDSATAAALWRQAQGSPSGSKASSAMARKAAAFRTSSPLVFAAPVSTQPRCSLALSWPGARSRSAPPRSSWTNPAGGRRPRSGSSSVEVWP